jgi:hypothetical protein
LDLLTILCTISLNYNQYSAVTDLHTFKFTIAHALGFSLSTSRLLATDLNIETITSNHYEDFLPFILQSPWNADSPELDPVLQFCLQSPWFLTLYLSVLICTQLISSQLQTHTCYIDAAQTRITQNTCHVITTHCCCVTSLCVRKLHACVA